MFVLLSMKVALGQTCDVPTTGVQLQQAIQAAEADFAKMDAEGFTTSVAQARDIWTCLSEPVPTTLAAATHRVEALAGFIDRDADKTRAHFRSLLAIEPGYVISETLAPVGHPLREDFQAAGGMAAGPTTALPTSRSVVYLVDGVVSTQAPLQRPYFLQEAGKDGEIHWTRMMDSGALPLEALSDPAVTAKPGVEPFATVEPVAREHRARLPLLITAGLSAGVAGSLYYLATDREAQFWDPTTPNDELRVLRTETNTYAYLSIGMGAIALGTGTAAIFTGTW